MKRKLDVSKLNIKAILRNSDEKIHLFAPELRKRIGQPKKRIFDKKTLYLSR